MKFKQTILITGILLLIIGCQMKEVEETIVKGEATLTSAEVTEKKGYCALTATADKDGYFLIIDKLFAEGIPCDTNDDCYNFLLKEDDFKSLAPEFYAYLSCEKIEEPIAPNKINV